MTKSTITREESVQAVFDLKVGYRLGFADLEILKRVARMALAAMDSEPVALQPELAKVIYHFRDWNEGFPVERFKADYVISWMLANYPPAQPAPVVPEEWTIADAVKFCKETGRQDAGAAMDAWNACRAAMLQAKSLTSINPAPALVPLQKNAKSLTGNSPVIGIDLASGPDRTVEVRYVAPPGYVMVPMRLTAENGAKGALSGEFSETKFVNCPECFGDDECETCDGSGRIEITVPVTWTTIKEIWAKGVEHFAAAPQSPGSEPATVPGKWIPVSERMPEKGQAVLVYRPKAHEGGDSDVRVAVYGRHNFEHGFGCYWEPTHWMPLPAAPQEVKGE